MVTCEVEKKSKPVVGVFVRKHFLSHSKGRLFGRKLVQANKEADCIIYFFSPDDIDWQNNSIRGRVFEPVSGRWLGEKLPFPDIIYDRGVFGGSNKKNAEATRDRLLGSPGIQFINSGRLIKWAVCKRLARHRVLKRYLPETVLYRRPEDLNRMIARYGFIFLKASGGSGGRSVLSIEKKRNGFLIRFHQKGKHQERMVYRTGALQKEITNIMKTSDRIVIQQGIPLIKYKGRLLDLRVLMVKDKDGAWNAVYNQARVAQKGAVITNLSLGGDVMNYSDIYAALKTNCPHLPTDQEIRNICVMLCGYIEKEFGPFGEIGMDIGVDESGKVWLLEANSKPSKLPEQVIEDTKGISPQFLMILEYARLLYSRSRNDHT